MIAKRVSHAISRYNKHITGVYRYTEKTSGLSSMYHASGNRQHRHLTLFGEYHYYSAYDASIHYLSNQPSIRTIRATDGYFSSRSCRHAMASFMRCCQQMASRIRRTNITGSLLWVCHDKTHYAHMGISRYNLESGQLFTRALVTTVDKTQLAADVYEASYDVLDTTSQVRHLTAQDVQYTVEESHYMQSLQSSASFYVNGKPLPQDGKYRLTITLYSGVGTEQFLSGQFSLYLGQHALYAGKLTGSTITFSVDKLPQKVILSLYPTPVVLNYLPAKREQEVACISYDKQRCFDMDSDINVFVNYPPVIVNARVDTLSNALYQFDELYSYCPFLAKYNEQWEAVCHDNSPLTHEKTLKHLLPFFREESALNDVYRRLMLSDNELAYFKANGNSLTVFVHGFDVPYGQYGPTVWFSPDGAASLDGPPIESDYRDANIMMKQYGAEIAGQLSFPEDDKLNGEGAHNWFVHIEHNLQLANDGEHQRCVHFAWQGDPVSILDYMASERMSLLAGISLVRLIANIRKAQPDMRINVIGHSQGCAVLTYAMDYFGRHSPGMINNAFLWQGAVPDTVLSPDPSTNTKRFSGHWGTTYASEGAQKIVVLYTRNDYILGPSTHRGQSDLVEMLLQCLDDMPLQNKPESVYHAAALFGVSFDRLFFNEKARADFIKRWQRCYPDAISLPMSSEPYVAAIENMTSLLSLYFAMALGKLMSFIHNPAARQEMAALQGQENVLDESAMINKLFEVVVKDKTALPDKMLSGLSSLFDMSKLGKIAASLASRLIVHLLYNAGSEHDYVPGCVDNLGHALKRDAAKWVLGDFIMPLGKALQSHTPAMAMMSDAQIMNAAQGLSTVIVMVFMTPGATVENALGYSGPCKDLATQALISSGKLICIDQGELLQSHSGMKVPAQQLIEDIYRDVILKECRRHMSVALPMV